jgi:hypothetical protein
MPHRAVGAFLALSLGLGATGRADPPSAPPDEELQRLISEHEAAQRAWYERMSKLEQEGKLEAIDMVTVEREFAPRFRAYAERHAGTPKALPALVWMLENPLIGPEGPEAGSFLWPMDQMKAGHSADPRIADVMSTLPHTVWLVGRAPVVSLCEKVLSVNTDGEARAGATYAMAVALFDEWGSAEDRDAERAKGLFRKLVAEHAESPFARTAEGYLFEIEHLAVGMKAPEIAGTNPAGDELRLSQFKGQVVVLDFWGFW